MSAQSVLKQLRDYRNCLKHLNKQFLGNYYFHLFKITNSLIVNVTKTKEKEILFTTIQKFTLTALHLEKLLGIKNNLDCIPQ